MNNLYRSLPGMGRSRTHNPFFYLWTFNLSERSALRTLKENKDFTDVTLACEEG